MAKHLRSVLENERLMHEAEVDTSHTFNRNMEHQLNTFRRMSIEHQETISNFEKENKKLKFEINRLQNMVLDDFKLKDYFITKLHERGESDV